MWIKLYYVEEVDDKPQMDEFPSIVPESRVSTTIQFSYLILIQQVLLSQPINFGGC